MAVFLRDLGIPTRIVEGFLPGSRDPNAGDRADPQQQRPRLGRGLLPGLRLGRLRPDRRRRRRSSRRCRPGDPIASRSPRPSSSDAPVAARPLDRRRRRGRARRRWRVRSPAGRLARAADRGRDPAAADRRRRRWSPCLAARAARRGRRPTTRTERSPGSPSRFGFGPRPTQTVYEYAGALGEVAADRPARARDRGPGQGRVVYGARDPRRRPAREPAGGPRRLRVGLLRLAFRRERPPPPLDGAPLGAPR